MRWLKAGSALVPLVVLAGACGSPGHQAGPTTSASAATSSSTTSSPTTTNAPTSTATTTTSTTVPLTLAHGPETVLSPIGLNVRAKPSKSAAVIGTAAQGAVFQLVAHTSRNGGWYEVSGPSVTGWISANRAFSAPGRFGAFTSNAFSALYPAGWTSAGSPRSGVTFQAPSTPEKVVITAAPSLAKLPSVKQGAGVSQSGSLQVVGCGVSAYLVSYTTSVPGRYLADVAFRINAHHALGLKATLTSLAEVSSVLDFVNSVSFPFPVCVGAPPKTTTTAHRKAAPTSSSRPH